MTHKEDAIEHLEKAKESLALAEEPEKSGIVSNLKRDLQIKPVRTQWK